MPTAGAPAAGLVHDHSGLATAPARRAHGGPLPRRSARSYRPRTPARGAVAGVPGLFARATRAARRFHSTHRRAGRGESALHRGNPRDTVGKRCARLHRGHLARRGRPRQPADPRHRRERAHHPHRRPGLRHQVGPAVRLHRRPTILVGGAYGRPRQPAGGPRARPSLGGRLRQIATRLQPARRTRIPLRAPAAAGGGVREHAAGFAGGAAWRGGRLAGEADRRAVGGIRRAHRLPLRAVEGAGQSPALPGTSRPFRLGSRRPERRPLAGRPRHGGRHRSR